MTSQKAIILFSGGVDSTVLLTLLKKQNFSCYALTIMYGQRQQQEITAAKRIAKQLQIEQHRVVQLEINQWGGSSLTNFNLAVPHQPSLGIPNTYVPARNTIFLSTALGWAEAIGAYDIFIGANQDDYINYPDCRPEYFHAFSQLANLATREGVQGHEYKIHAPLATMSKVDIIKLGAELNIDFSATFSCYDPQNDQACELCEACRLRREGLQSLTV